jgi:hypothetical protein
MIETLFFLYINMDSVHLRKNQLDAQPIFSILRQKPLHVSGLSKTHHQEVHHMDTTIGTYYSF